MLFFTLIVNIILNYYLILQYQAKGAIFATVLSMFIGQILMFLKTRSLIKK
jgi:Na+-driven multidrug efflux pump